MSERGDKPAAGLLETLSKLIAAAPRSVPVVVVLLLAISITQSYLAFSR